MYDLCDNNICRWWDITGWCDTTTHHITSADGGTSLVDVILPVGVMLPLTMPMVGHHWLMWYYRLVWCYHLPYHIIRWFNESGSCDLLDSFLNESFLPNFLQSEFYIPRYMALPSNVIINIPILASVVADSPFNRDNPFFELGFTTNQWIYYYYILWILKKSIRHWMFLSSKARIHSRHSALKLTWRGTTMNSGLCLLALIWVLPQISLHYLLSHYLASSWANLFLADLHPFIVVFLLVLHHFYQHKNPQSYMEAEIVSEEFTIKLQ